MSILQDILRDDLKEEDKKILIQEYFFKVFSEGLTKSDFARSKTLGNAASLLDFYDFVNQAIDNYESRQGVTEANQVLFTEEEPDNEAKNESIVFGLVKRQPGAFSRGAPLEASVKNQRPIVREILNDVEHPTYKKIVLGYWYDNVVRFTCWARTNKAANRRAEWFEDLMEEYLWWFKLKGVNRVLFLERQPDIAIEINSNKWYGRPIDFFVRTEKIRIYSEKALEQVLLKVAVTR